MNSSGLPANLRVVSALPDTHAGFSVSNLELMAALSRAEDAHFWHRCRNRFIARRLRGLGSTPPASILELGCGGGCVTAFLSRAGWRVTGVEGHLSRARQAADRAPDAAIVVHDLRLGLEPLGDERWDAVAFFDVIEHLEDPISVLTTALGRVMPGGLLVGTVPALMSLWSDVDVRSGHRVRYERSVLLDLLRALPGSDVLEVIPFNRILVPLLWLQRRASADALEQGLKVPWAPFNTLFQMALSLDHRVGPLLNRAGIPGASLWFAVRVR